MHCKCHLGAFNYQNSEVVMVDRKGHVLYWVLNSWPFHWKRPHRFCSSFRLHSSSLWWKGLQRFWCLTEQTSEVPNCGVRWRAEQVCCVRPAGWACSSLPLQILQRVDDNTVVSYDVASGAAGGVVSARCAETHPPPCSRWRKSNSNPFGLSISRSTSSRFYNLWIVWQMPNTCCFILMFNSNIWFMDHYERHSEYSFFVASCQIKQA